MAEDEEKSASPAAEEEEVENDGDETAVVVDDAVGKSNGVPAKSGSRSASSSRSRSRKRSGSHHRSSKRRHRRKRSKSRSRSPSRGRSNKRARRKRSPSSSSVSRSRSRDRRRRAKRRSRSHSRSRSPGFRRGGGGGFGGGGPRSRFNGPRLTHWQDCPPPTRCLGVFGMNVNTNESTLAHYFQPYGKIDKIQIIYDAKSGRSRGFAFIYFDTVQEAIDAKDGTAGEEIDGFRIRVDFSLTQRPHTPTPGIYMGKPMGRDEFYGGFRRGRSPSPPYRRRSRSRSYS